jgi:predicted RNA methylase
MANYINYSLHNSDVSSTQTKELDEIQLIISKLSLQEFLRMTSTIPKIKFIDSKLICVKLAQLKKDDRSRQVKIAKEHVMQTINIHKIKGEVVQIQSAIKESLEKICLDFSIEKGSLQYAFHII